MKLKFEVEIEVTEEFKKQFLFMMEDMIGAMSPLVSKNEFRKMKKAFKENSDELIPLLTPRLMGRHLAFSNGFKIKESFSTVWEYVDWVPKDFLPHEYFYSTLYAEVSKVIENYEIRKKKK